MIQQILFGMLLSGLVSLLAYKKQSLSKSGVIAAVIVGTNIYAFGSLFWYGLLLTFFISSSFLSHLKKKKKEKVENDRFAKTGRRDAMQVLANGGIGMILVWIAVGIENPGFLFAIYIGVMATVNADTWGTELGVLANGKTRHILTGRIVEKGMSGGLSVWGTVGTGLGALCIGIFGAFFLWIMNDEWTWIWIYIGFLSGFSGAMLDSFLGATMQQMYWCSACGRETEKRTHCRFPARRKRGFAWCNNDAVNMVSSIGGGFIAWASWVLLT